MLYCLFSLIKYGKIRHSLLNYSLNWTSDQVDLGQFAASVVSHPDIKFQIFYISESMLKCHHWELVTEFWIDFEHWHYHNTGIQIQPNQSQVRLSCGCPSHYNVYIFNISHTQRPLKLKFCINGATMVSVKGTHRLNTFLTWLPRQPHFKGQNVLITDIIRYHNETFLIFAYCVFYPASTIDLRILHTLVATL